MNNLFIRKLFESIWIFMFSVWFSVLGLGFNGKYEWYDINEWYDTNEINERNEWKDMAKS